MDLTTLRSETRIRTGIPSDDSLITDAVLTSNVNAAIQMIAGKRDWPWLEASANVSTVASQGEYAVPADWVRTVSVISPSGIPLRRTPIDEIDYLNGSGTPRFFGIFGDQLVVKPTPSAIETLRHRYVKTSPALSSNGDTPTIPAAWHHVIVEYAAYLVFRRTGNLSEAGAALAQFDKWTEEMAEQADRWSDSQGGALGADAPKAKASA